MSPVDTTRSALALELVEHVKSAIADLCERRGWAIAADDEDVCDVAAYHTGELVADLLNSQHPDRDEPSDAYRYLVEALCEEDEVAA